MAKTTIELLAIVREGIGQMPPVSSRELNDEDVVRIAGICARSNRPRASATIGASDDVH
jgi:hypothetical protein